jgi:uncharacterized protein YggE
MNANMVYSQRNGNQKKFKSKSNEQYNVKNYENNVNQNFKQQDFDDYTKNGNIGSNNYTSNNEVVLEVRSLMNMKADRFLAVFNVTQIGESAAKTDELLNSRIDAFTIALKQMGINEKDIYVDMIYLVPTFEFEMEKKFFSKTYNEVPTGFEMQKNIHVTFKDINKVDDMVTLAAKNEIYDLVKLDFFVDNTEAVYDSLRNKSVACLTKKMASFKKLNLVLSDKFQILRESSYAIYPETQYPDYDAFVTQSLEAVKKNSGVTKIRKPKTVAYDQVPYNRYDIIVNPGILEPVVQYVYTIQVKYTLDKPEVKSKNSYMIITPTGEVKKLDLQ